LLYFIEPQLEALRSIIATAPNPNEIRNELSPEALQYVHTEDDIKTD
jgi:hypothetical protein